MDFRDKAWIFRAIMCFSLLICSTKALVSYDHKALIINGQKRILLSGSIHYARSTPEMWPDLIKKAKEGGLDVIQTYVFWNGHEPSPGQYYFGDRYDLVKFIKLVQQADLYVSLRIGPYVCAEWNFGGIPVWLKYVSGMVFRTDNGPFKTAMQKFTKKIVDIMKEEKLFEAQGGPIILSQIENEYGPMEWEIGLAGKAYTKWTAAMALDLSTGVPWVMCKQDDAPYPIINTCNGFYCEGFKPNSVDQPKIWTENWTGWFTEFGGAIPNRPVEDLAFSVARFIQNGGSFMNYYMYYGGTNFDRTSGQFIATSYDYDAPLDEYGLLREPKYSHLKELHKVIKLCEPALVSVDPTITSLGDKQEAHVFMSETSCAAFLSNYDTSYAVKVMFRGFPYELPPWSISILPDCKTEYHNTAKVRSPSILMKMVPTSTRFSWESYNEAIASSSDYDTFAQEGLLEQVSMTRDKTDYFWYLTDITIGSDESFLKTGEDPLLTICSAGHALHVFVNGQLAGTSYGALSSPKFTFSEKVKLHEGVNKLALLSTAVGLPSSFNAPVGNEPLALDMNTMGKGQVWVNGRNIGRHWPAYTAHGNCGSCNYAGIYNEKKCLSNCGQSSQRWYHVPRSWLKPFGNLLVVFEEWGGDPSGISLVKRTNN